MRFILCARARALAGGRVRCSRTRRDTVVVGSDDELLVYNLANGPSEHHGTFAPTQHLRMPWLTAARGSATHGLPLRPSPVGAAAGKAAKRQSRFVVMVFSPDASLFAVALADRLLVYSCDVDRRGLLTIGRQAPTHPDPPVAIVVFFFLPHPLSPSLAYACKRA